MTSITVRNLEEGLERRLRVRAAENGRSMEQEVKDILKTALDQEPTESANLASAIRARFAPLGGIKLNLPPRDPMREPPDLR